MFTNIQLEIMEEKNEEHKKGEVKYHILIFCIELNSNQGYTDGGSDIGSFPPIFFHLASACYS